MRDDSRRSRGTNRGWIDRLLLRRRRGERSDRGLLEVCFGPLELRVLEALWSRTDAVGVRRLQAEFPGLAYTTLMTTLDRLFKKDLLRRRKEGRAYLYTARHGREELESLLARDAIEDLLQGQLRRGGPEPLLSGFVEAVGRRDLEMLDELERLVRRHRSSAAGAADSEEPR
jgi:predicted transcriptional regulator